LSWYNCTAAAAAAVADDDDDESAMQRFTCRLRPTAVELSEDEEDNTSGFATQVSAVIQGVQSDVTELN